MLELLFGYNNARDTAGVFPVAAGNEYVVEAAMIQSQTAQMSIESFGAIEKIKLESRPQSYARPEISGTIAENLKKKTD